MKDNQKRPVGLNKYGKIVAVGSAVLVGASLQAAPITAPSFASNITDVGVLLGAMIGFGAFVWGARKLLGFAG